MTVDDLLANAEAGDADAQYQLGVAFRQGDAVPQDHAAATAWYLRAAEQGHLPAQYNAGVAHLKGLGVPEDRAEATRWFEAAAEGEDADAAYILGLMAREDGDHEAMERWLLQAVQRNHAAAHHAVAKLAIDGLLPSLPAEEAPYLLKAAIDLGHAESVDALAELAETGAPAALHAYGLVHFDRKDFRRARELTGRAAAAGVEAAAEIAGALEEMIQAQDELLAAAQGGDAGQQVFLALAYLDGGGLVPKDPETGASWLRRAAEGGSAEAAKLVAMGYLQGENGFAQDPAEAVRWLERAGPVDEAMGFVLTLAANQLFTTLQEAHAAPERWAGLKALLELSAQAGNGDAYVLLAAIASQGLAGPADPAAALAYAARGVELGSADAKSQLAGMLVDGAGTAVDLPRAASMLTEAQAGGGSYPGTAEKLGLALHAAGDAEAAAPWLEQAAGAGSGPAAHALARSMFACGDEVGAANAYALAYGLGQLPDPQTPIERCGAAIHVLGASPTPEADRQAVAWLREAAEAGIPVARQQLSRLLFGGKHGVERDPAEGLKWARLAADAGNPDACRRLATMALKGDGMDRDVAAAVGWFERAADGGVRDAALALARLYEAGEDVPADLGKAATWYERAFALGYKDGEWDAQQLRKRMG